MDRLVSVLGRREATRRVAPALSPSGSRHGDGRFRRQTARAKDSDGRGTLVCGFDYQPTLVTGWGEASRRALPTSVACGPIAEPHIAIGEQEAQTPEHGPRIQAPAGSSPQRVPRLGFCSSSWQTRSGKYCLGGAPAAPASGGGGSAGLLVRALASRARGWLWRGGRERLVLLSPR